MKYGITKTTFSSPGSVEINKNEYEKIRDARENLFETLFLEEKFDLVAENYYEYETELLSIASRMMVFHDDDYFSMGDERNLVGRRIANLMSACRLYLDQSSHHLNKIYKDIPDVAAEIEIEKSKKYDSVLGYRVMEALRNYTQHRGFPIHTVRFSSKRVGGIENYQLLHNVIPLLKPFALAEDGKFKKSILNELLEIQNDEYVDIRPLLREYIEAIGKLHELIREKMKLDVQNWEEILNKVFDRFKEKFGADTSLVGLAIVIENEVGKWEEHKTIFSEFIEKRKKLELKNRFFNNLHKKSASNEVFQKKENS